MACNCNKSRGGMDDASVNYLLSLVKQEPDANGELSLLDTGNPLIQALVDIILEKAQYLDPVGLEYLISRLQLMYVVRVDGMGLTHNDFTDILKKKLEDLPDAKALKDLLDQLAGAGLSMTIVNQLPSTGDERKIYFVPRDKTATNNIYDEYIYIGGKWELIGSTDISGLVSLIKMNGQSLKPDANGVIDLGTVVTKETTIKINGTEKKPNANGVIDLGTVQTSAVDLSGYMPTTGGTFTGDVRLQTNNESYGSVLRFGDGNYAYITEDKDDHFEIYSRLGINFKFPSSGSFTINGVDLDTYIKNVAGDGSVDIDVGVKSITMNGSTKTPNSSGVAALGGVCVKITMNGSTYSVNTSGTIALGTVGGSGSANAIHTGTTEPAASLGSDGDFYYKMK